MAAVAVVACTGCQLRLAVDVELNRDGGGTLDVAVTADEELLGLADDAGADPLGDLGETAAELGDGWRLRDTSADDGTRTVALSAPFEDPEAFATLTAELADALEAEEVDLLDGMTVTVTDAEVALTGAAAARPTRVVREYGLTRRRAVRLLRRTDAFVYTVTAVMPGEILTAQGARGDDRSATWTVAPGRRVEFEATSARPGLPWVRGVAGALAGGLVAAVVLWVLARRRRGVRRGTG